LKVIKVICKLGQTQEQNPQFGLKLMLPLKTHKLKLLVVFMFFWELQFSWVLMLELCSAQKAFERGGFFFVGLLTLLTWKRLCELSITS
jgi:hypothetical protein